MIDYMRIYDWNPLSVERNVEIHFTWNFEKNTSKKAKTKQNQRKMYENQQNQNNYKEKYEYNCILFSIKSIKFYDSDAIMYLNLLPIILFWLLFVHVADFLVCVCVEYTVQIFILFESIELMLLIRAWYKF